MSPVTIEDFQKLDIRIAKVVKVEEIVGADKLLKLTLDVGELGERTIAAGIKEFYTSDELIGKLIVYLANLEPKILKGVESQGMLLAADSGEPVILQPEKDVAPGSKIR
ncbi:methionine--tRNA ligase subunit beta [Candidatus Woesebacteria bacterium RIFCSPHIGHO2_01_FULL_38_9]|uniref:Methionine--tRNA ligase n=2 Tax=Candidatus Woeseibacteriota TaxID=1752722 RepID=A0A1F7Y2Z6_9BACT|nr:MAG: methionine--tRNA ligase subunit beta [Candidatus Woesebacteria bacterium RIFCSPHIGHO2_01_FULL_38_9]OGM59086.1 MAG: methionine--tRNA ligase subunit beta [Candidatus Woesebacteria bacterium RIFCSPLOWO2_01_FULL_39_10]